MSDSKLYAVQWSGVRLLDAISQVGASLGVDPIAMTSSPRSFHFWRVRSDGSLRSADGRACHDETIFDCRAFGEAGELRWLHRNAGLGDAVLLSEHPAVGDSTPAGKSTDLESPMVITDTIDHRYLLWGTAAKSVDPSWTRLAEPRVGAFDVPLEGAARGGRVYLCAREYLVEGEHGNVSVADERLIGLEAQR